MPEFPLFKDLSLEDKPILDLALKQFPPLISEFTFTNLFIWRHAYQIKISRLQSFLCLFAENGEYPFFFSPIGEGDVVECCRTLLRLMKEKGVSVKIARVPEEVASRFDWKSEGFVVEFDRDQSDYIYLSEDLIHLLGRKYHRKRNHIKQFKEKFSYQYLPLTLERISDCLLLETEWCDLRQCEVMPGLHNESIAIKEAFAHFEALGVKGGVILIDGKVEAFTLGEPLNQDTVVIHIEKANPAFEGLYPVINQAFLENHWSEYTYVNREQDLGEEGLRKAKESYFPHRMINKYSISLNE
ncbi:MAG: phosphatidylglycerol lysyltransferase domain-containing protein [Thermodesulfobacteriota bacterium]|nr:phosphatidylglycerol lysyltransferase domain-containing protein [Thermodesulfobacteriota bacterium]